MKTLYAILCLSLLSLPGVSQIAPLALRKPHVEVDTITYDNIRRYMAHQDSVVAAGEIVIRGQRQTITNLKQQVANRDAEVERQRKVNGQQAADNAELTKQRDKANALPLRPPIYADTRALGLAVLTFLVGLLIAKH